MLRVKCLSLLFSSFVDLVVKLFILLVDRLWQHSNHKIESVSESAHDFDFPVEPLSVKFGALVVVLDFLSCSFQRDVD